MYLVRNFNLDSSKLNTSFTLGKLVCSFSAALLGRLLDDQMLRELTLKRFWAMKRSFTFIKMDVLCLLCAKHCARDKKQKSQTVPYILKRDVIHSGEWWPRKNVLIWESTEVLKRTIGWASP